MSEYQGKVIHAQFFDNTIDYQDKKVIVVGSGATAVTLVPALAESGASNVTMIQRSPTYIVSLPSTDSLNLKLRTSKYIPTWLANFIIFWRASLLSVYIYWYARRNPLQMKKYIIDGVRKHLTVNGKEIVDVDKHFTPTYMPWDQRLCLTPDQQFFNAIRNGKVQIYTDKISKFTKNGIILENESNEIEADIIVLATGLNLEVMNNIPIFVDNELINVSETLLYKDMMLTKIPNMTFCMGYINSSWTLKVDMSCRYMCRIINYMSQKNYKKIVVTPNDPLMPQYPMIPNVSSGYILRSISKFPKTGDSFPWIRLSNYVKDLFMFTFSSVTEKEFRYS
jgi:cation diffusion facilitator CzcD-associated flavoprotein CzcO